MWMIRRALSACVVFLGVSLLLFYMCRLTPVSPARVVLGADALDEQIVAFERQHGLDLPIPAQYEAWIRSIFSDGFGESYITNLPIGEEIARTLPVTVELVVFALLVTVVGAILLGAWAAIREGDWPDHLLRVVSICGLSIPGFWLALLLIKYFSVELGWFPPGGLIPIEEGILEHVRSIFLPALAIAFYYIAVLSRLMRASMIEALSQDYVRTARAMGLSRMRTWTYALKNALPPFISMVAMVFGYMFGWALIVEQVFNLPGVSRALLTAVFQRDYPMIQAVVLIITAVFVVSNTAADMALRFVNPRLKG